MGCGVSYRKSPGGWPPGYPSSRARRVTRRSTSEPSIHYCHDLPSRAPMRERPQFDCGRAGALAGGRGPGRARGCEVAGGNENVTVPAFFNAMAFGRHRERGTTETERRIGLGRTHGCPGPNALRQRGSRDRSAVPSFARFGLQHPPSSTGWQLHRYRCHETQHALASTVACLSPPSNQPETGQEYQAGALRSTRSPCKVGGECHGGNGAMENKLGRQAHAVYQSGFGQQRS